MTEPWLINFTTRDRRPGESKEYLVAHNSLSIQSYEGRRVSFDSARSFDEVLQSLRQLVGTAALKSEQKSRGTARESTETLGGEYISAMQGMGAISRSNFEQVVRSQVGESGFMLFHEIDHGEWLPLYGIQRRAVRWILGNPLIAITMIRHDITAGLFAPVELLLTEDETGDGSAVIYDLPFALMRIEQNPAMLEAAHELDHKLAVLVSRCTGVVMDQAAEQRIR